MQVAALNGERNCVSGHNEGRERTRNMSVEIFFSASAQHSIDALVFALEHELKIWLAGRNAEIIVVQTNIEDMRNTINV